MIRSITIKNAYIPELIEIYGRNWREFLGLDELGDPIPNPQTKSEFAALQFDNEWRQTGKATVQNYRKRVANSNINMEDIIE